MLLVCLLAADTPVSAQHVELGAFGDYTKVNISGFGANAFGVGVRAGFNVHRYLQLEVESAYDVKHAHFAFSQSSGSFIINNSKLGILHANGGVKLQSRGGSFFVFLKGGSNWYRPERTTTIVTGPPITAPSSIEPLNTFNRPVLYPGAGIGFHAGPLGIRFDAGDEITWDGGAHHNLRVTFGPTLRF